MKIVDLQLRSSYATPGCCEVCGKPCRSREAHHVFARGQGGCTTLDVEINLLAVGTAFQCPCHRDIHDGRIKRERLLEIVAAKYGRTAEDVKAELLLLIRTPRGWTDR